MSFFREKFEFLVVTFVFIFMFWLWVQSEYRGDIKELLIAVFGAWLALLRVIQKPSTVETAKTQTGDVVVSAPPGG